MDRRAAIFPTPPFPALHGNVRMVRYA